MSTDDVLRENEDRLMAIEGVVGVGIAEKDGVPAISVMVTADTAEIKSQIPNGSCQVERALSWRGAQPPRRPDVALPRAPLPARGDRPQWCTKLGPAYAAGLRRGRARSGDKWHLDEVLLKIRGKRHWLWRAVDQDGVVLDILVQERRATRHQLSDSCDACCNVVSTRAARGHHG